MYKSLLNGRRSAIDIVYDILTVCDNGGINKTAIMYRSNLSYDQLKKYLDLLAGQGMIDRNDFGDFQITGHGQKTLAKVLRVRESLRVLRRELEPATAM